MSRSTEILLRSLNPRAYHSTALAKAGLIKHRRMKQIRERSDFRNNLIGKCGAISNPGREAGIVLSALRDDSQINVERGQQLTGAVVQFATQTAALFILQSQDAGRELAQHFFGLHTPLNFAMQQLIGPGEL